MELSQLGKAPIAGDKPAGGDCRYDAAFESLQAQIDKLASPTASGKVDWPRVVELSTAILSETSKDLIVAGYLAVGLIHTRQIDGLDEGILILKDLVENFWDHLYPEKKRMRGRTGAIFWWMEKTENELPKLKPGPVSAHQTERIQANLNALDRLLADKMPDSPVLRSLVRQVRQMPVQQPKAAQAPPAETKKDPATESPSPPSAKAISTPVVPARSATISKSIESEQDVRESIDAVVGILRRCSHFLIQHDLTNPLAYRYRRMASWAKVETSPAHVDGVTQLPPPAPQVIQQLNDLQEDDNWPALIQQAEQKVSQFVFWLDLHFMVSKGLETLGPTYRNALHTVRRECAWFLQLCSGIETLCFADGTPFAQPATLQWLKEIVPGGNGNSANRDDAPNAPEDPFNSIVQQALAMARQKQLVPAVDLLQQQMLASSSGSAQMRWRLAIVRVLLTAKKYRPAIPHLEKILSDIDGFNLEQWDPLIALEGLTTVWKGYAAQSANGHKQRADEILARIAQISPVEAVRLGTR
jgi:type VI secretion system protein VasJ